MKASESLQNDQSTVTENAPRRAVDTTPALIHAARPGGTWITLTGDGWIFLLSHSKAFVGGAGMVDELFEAIILIQTRKITRASRS
jgi:hypothetical protein